MMKLPRTAQQLCGDLEEHWAGKELQLADVIEYGNQLGSFCCFTPEQQANLNRSFLQLLGKTLSAAALRETIQRAVLGASALMEGPLSPLSVRHGRYDVKCEQVDVGATITLRLRFLEGPLANQVLVRPASQRFLQWLGREIGLTTRRRRVLHPRELVGCAFRIVVVREGGRLKMTDLSATQQQMGYNTRLRRARKRRCPKMRCYLCFKSWRECDLSTHTAEWQSRPCGICGATTYHNEAGQCVGCAERAYLTGEGADLADEQLTQDLEDEEGGV